MTPLPPGSTLFPYTTLFRSTLQEHVPVGALVLDGLGLGLGAATLQLGVEATAALPRGRHVGLDRERELGPRSEEHTSELQSHVNLVCRLLLEKKKNPEDVRA